MTNVAIEEGVVHEVPDDLKRALRSNAELLEKWNKLTPLARNEWICWTTIVKQQKTRAEHIKRLSGDIAEGKKRPCCWPGCPHRRASARKWFK
ncbi:YdeI/OmpD-associated family protein [Parapedobacter sp. 10938]|uniref:YdeI/OmpD-associated family protein n=1 Tax=Parapedobacter flavus TaxID=3110225 RepID=UPI002DB7EE8E|nr:YdeI/OmpD-associated family protein [Parapedobacter sp. 10938]MEC3879073.1 YdeI/OmpD-associated family protein [Parapedobacter sp. 10938]